MKVLSVDIGERSYEIRIAPGWDFGAAAESLGGRKALVVSDSNVDPLYGDALDAALKGLKIEASRLVLEAGERSKSMESMGRIYDAALAAGLDRKSAIIALGGGVVGDVAGFAAATFMRGVRFVQVPTTLLSMVDSAVGGKTAVNLKQGKNLVGAFYQPVEVDVSLDALDTLSAREFSAGMAEVIKYGVIWDAEFLSMLEHRTADIMNRDRDVMAEVVSRCCEIKSEVVAIDERESGVRGILNFGHTLAHSLENVCGYGECLHGEAVSVGMVYALRLSVLAKELNPADEARVRSLLKAVGLPVAPSELKSGLSWPALRALMVSDKKTEGGVPRFVLAECMGSVCIGCELEDSVLAGAYDAVFAEDN